MRARRGPAAVHPGAWWLWAGGLATATQRTTNPLLLGLIACVAGYVVAARRQPDAPWARSYAGFLRLAVIALLVGLALGALTGGGRGTTVLLRLPQVPLPSWMAGVQLGGAVTAEALTAAGYAGLRLGVLLLCVGAANALASPARLLRLVPAALYEVGVVLTVAVSFAPQAVAASARVREARRLRGRSARGLRAMRATAVPVLEAALEHSVDLAAAMDSRGFGRRGDASRGRRTLGAGLLLGGLLAVTASCYGLLSDAAPRALGLPLLALGTASAVGGTALASLTARRSRYRPDRWRWLETAVAAAGLLPAVAFSVAAAHGDPGLTPGTDPVVAPSLPSWLGLAVLAGLLPAVLAPRPAREPGAALRPAAGVSA